MLLAIDTSTRYAGVALYDGIQVTGEVIWISQDHHTVELVPVIAEVLQRAGKKVTDLTALGVALGPGSFTGLRIGLAAAKGMALGAHPLVRHSHAGYPGCCPAHPRPPPGGGIAGWSQPPGSRPL